MRFEEVQRASGNWWGVFDAVQKYGTAVGLQQLTRSLASLRNATTLHMNEFIDHTKTGTHKVSELQLQLHTVVATTMIASLVFWVLRFYITARRRAGLLAAHAKLE